MLMNIKKKMIYMLSFVIIGLIFINGVYAASASISASKTTAYVGDKVTVTVKITAATWNVHVSGSASDSIVGFNADAENQTTTKKYTINASKVGTYTVKISGDVTDESDANLDISKSVTITVKEKPVTDENTNNATTTKKSTNANISALKLSVEGLKFKSSQTSYDINVGENVDSISVQVTLSDKKATYSISGNKNLKAGNNTIKIVVTAEAGNKKTYKINVNKKGNIEDISSELSNLIIEDMMFTTPFVSTETEYVGSKMKYMGSLNILPYTVAEEATYEIIGNDNFKEGENEVIIRVTSKDGSNTTDYKVKFIMMSEEESNALQVISPYVEQDDTYSNNKKQSEVMNKYNTTIILLYLLALIEFVQVVYLYIKLQQVNPQATKICRRNNNK